jgi:hypothetical protein
MIRLGPMSADNCCRAAAMPRRPRATRSASARSAARLLESLRTGRERQAPYPASPGNGSGVLKSILAVATR